MKQEPISLQDASTIQALFSERVRRTPDKVAFREFDASGQCWRTSTWQQMAHEVARWQGGLMREGLQAGDCVAILLPNSRKWVVFDQAAAGMGLVTVPLYFNDRADNVAYILRDADVKLLIVNEVKQWEAIAASAEALPALQRVVCIQSIISGEVPGDSRLTLLTHWLFGVEGEPQAWESNSKDLATIVYTSGTTGRPKGVMLSHKNILANAAAAIQCAAVNQDDVFLSFLPLSHTLERTIGYYVPIMLGAEVVYARSVNQLAEDLVTVRPTVLVSVPRIYERIYGRIQEGLKDKSAFARQLFAMTIEDGWARFEYQQHRRILPLSIILWPLLERLVARKVMARLGGRLRVAICGGAALSPEVSRLFIALGMPLIQGYGLTEASPVVSVNRLDDNLPESIGTALPGIEVRIAEDDELQTRSDCVMLGYWRNEQATAEVMTDDGWLRTGDQARIDEQGHIFITGRLKDIIVLANGEKLPPADMEMAILLDSLFEQVMIVGEGKPYLGALVVLNQAHWERLADMLGVDAQDPEVLNSKKVHEAVLTRIATAIRAFPGYAQVRRVALTLEPWSVENGLQTPTLKVKRAKVLDHFSEAIAAMYQGHGL